jgi:demethylmenaquinone methyltransferase/2-methoxy-6-polyprenyl-1,4-benzoquinol methylase
MCFCWDPNPAIEMDNTITEDKARYVQGMFGRIAERYDLMNRLMTAGQDRRWRQEVVRRSGLGEDDHILDLGAGTGDLSREAIRQVPGCRATAADFTLEMMKVGKSRTPNTGVTWTMADALSLPFASGTFKSVVSGFLLRNVVDVRLALQEQFRVLKSGGSLVALDTTRPPDNMLRLLIDYYLRDIIPCLGRLITGETGAYAYLTASTQTFLKAEQLAAYIEQAGFHDVGFRRLMFGTVAIHWGRK